MRNREVLLNVFFVAIALILLGGIVDAQTKKRKTPVKKKPVVVQKAEAQPEPQPEVILPPKRNDRPNSGSETSTSVTPKPTPTLPAYSHRYEFNQPDFNIDHIVIEHDDLGAGKISFSKKGYGEMISDPVTVSSASLERINSAFALLNFLDANQSYQYEKDYSHLGTHTIVLKKDGRERKAEFNWTENKDVKTIAEEYRKIGNQAIWMFDINLARENQPLESPKLMSNLESMIRRREVADPPQLIAFLKQLTDDERIPLIARNSATKIVKQIEKQMEKEKK
ncbi:MAG: hypothetical protein ACT4O9_04450 [Blastocatellia bacterium]